MRSSESRGTRESYTGGGSGARERSGRDGSGKTGIAELRKGTEAAYDLRGNRSSRDYSLGSTLDSTYLYDLEDRLTSESRGSSTIIYAWADRGVLTRKTVDGVPTDYYSDFLGRITRTICATASLDWLYTYAPTGDRMKKANLVTPFNSEHYLPSDGDTLCDFTTSSGSEVETGVYVSPGVDGRVARIDPTKGGGDPLRTTYFFGDALQSVLQVTNASGVEIRKQFTDAWGNDIAGVGSGSSGNAGDRYGFTGRENDAESGLMHYRARSYDPMVGRFTSRDPVPYSNLYHYCQNNPTNMTDPSGRIPAAELAELREREGRAREQGRDALVEVYAERIRLEIAKDNLYDTDRAAYAGKAGSDLVARIEAQKSMQASLENEGWVLAIHSNAAEAGLPNDGNYGVGSGHAWLTVHNLVTEESHSYGLWPRHHELVDEANRSHPDTDLQVDFEYVKKHDPSRDAGSDTYGDFREGPMFYARRISSGQKSILNTIVSKPHLHSSTNNCASFASETFEAVTGVDIDADEWWGFETCREIGEHIIEANGGGFRPGPGAVNLPAKFRKKGVVAKENTGWNSIGYGILQGASTTPGALLFVPYKEWEILRDLIR